MVVWKVAHATLVVRAPGVQCISDPVLFDAFECGSHRFDPPVSIDAKRVAASCNVVVLSHRHMDHFSIRSLDLFDRACPVVYPRGDTAIASALGRMGFKAAIELEPNRSVDISGLELIATPSRVSFPEMGILFRTREATLWNLVDTVIDEAVVGFVKGEVGRVDLLAATYQPLVETELCADGLGSSFPYESYGKLLKNVLDIRPRCVTPASCGFRFAAAPWMNARAFPMTERRFLEDVTSLDPGIETLLLPPGAGVHVGKTTRRTRKLLPGVRLRGRTPAQPTWRPDQGVPPLVDHNPRGHAPRVLRRKVASYLDGAFLKSLRSREHRAWRDRLARLGVIWRLEVVYPEGARETRLYDFSNRRYVDERKLPFCKLQTTVTASSIVGALEGKQNAYSGLFGAGSRRVAVRLYEAHRGGASAAGDSFDDPLGRLLFSNADETFIDAELAALGY